VIQAAEVVGVEEEEEEEEEEAECSPTVQVATFAAGETPLEAGLEYFRCATIANFTARGTRHWAAVYPWIPGNKHDTM
jgi:hypothetical protein